MNECRHNTGSSALHWDQRFGYGISADLVSIGIHGTAYGHPHLSFMSNLRSLEKTYLTRCHVSRFIILTDRVLHGLTPRCNCGVLQISVTIRESGLNNLCTCSPEVFWLDWSHLHQQGLVGFYVSPNLNCDCFVERGKKAENIQWSSQYGMNIIGGARRGRRLATLSFGLKWW